MKKILLLLLCVLSVKAPSIIAQTNVSAGYVSGTWTIVGSPYNVIGNIEIPNNFSLIIEPGVIVNFQGAYKLNVQGQLLAIGTSSDTITFTADDNATGWMGIHFDNTALTNDTSKVENCILEYAKNINNSGGAFYFNNYSKAIISKSRISYCFAKYSGGGIYCFNSSPLISYNLLNNNSAQTSGGGICCYNSNSIITNNSILNNTGNGIACSNSNPKIIDNIINNNPGGGIYCDNSNPYINNNSISNNFGCGIYCNSSSPIIIKNLISNNNYSPGNGGGISCYSNSSPTISDNTIYNNKASAGGGGISCITGNSTIIGNIICNNSANEGGGISCNSTYSNFTISNNCISNNTAYGTDNGGGGIFLASGSPEIISNSIINNKAINGGGIHCYNGSFPDIYNSIFFGNKATNSGDQVFLGYNASHPSFYYCNLQGGIPTFGGILFSGVYNNNINLEPFFVAPSEASGSEYNGLIANWSLQENSPCINKGDSSITPSQTDIVGNPRIVDGRIDIGAYEYQECTTFVEVTSSNSNPYFCQGDSIILSANLANSYLWSNGETLQSIKISTSGNYCVTIKDSNNCSGTSDTIKAKVFSLPEKPNISENSSLTMCKGNTVILSSTASDSYLWNNSERTQSITVSNGGYYFVTIKDNNNCTATSDSISVNIIEIYTSQPANQNVISGDTAHFNIIALGDSLNYQWQVNNGCGFININNGSNYSGAHGASLDINDVPVSMDGNLFRCIVSKDSCISVTNIATLFVGCLFTDTTFFLVTDTIHISRTDTIFESIVDTSHFNLIDTTYITIIDTSHYNLIDTTFITVLDTIHTIVSDTIYTAKIDTIYETIIDTSHFNLIDTTYVIVIDTIYTTIFDTLYNTITDTLHVIQSDTAHITVTDTLIIKTRVDKVSPPENLNIIKVYPNPTNDHIYINTGNFNLLEGFVINITTSLGQIVFQSPINEQQFYIDLSTWGGTGFYILNIINDQGVFIDTRKIVLL